ncbi:MAG: hypothetical protein ACLRZH_07955 [Ruthenibacterium lactatiformans]
MQGDDGMQVILAVRGGAPGTMTAECAGALAAAECVVGAAAAGRAARGLHGAQSGSSAPAGSAAGRAGSAGIRLVRCGVQRRHGLYSGACGLLPLLAENGVAARVLPGISSVQLWPRVWAALAGLDARLRPRRGVRRGCGARQTGVFLTGGTLTRPRYARSCASGPGRAGGGENLSYPDERVTQATAAQCAQGAFAPLSGALAEAAPAPQRAPGADRRVCTRRCR